MAVGVLGYFGRLVSPAFPSDLCRPLHLSYGTVPRNSLVFVYSGYFVCCSYVPSLRRRGVHFSSLVCRRGSLWVKVRIDE